MQWTPDNHAGFTESNEPWLPVNSDFASVNVKVISATASSSA